METKAEIKEVARNDGNTVLCDVYYSLLRLFQGGENAYREWQSKPFVIGNNVYATDAHCIVFFEKSKVDYIAPLEGYEPNNILNLIPEERELIPISLAEIEKAFDKSNATEKQECDACVGQGNVHYSFYYEPEKEYYEKLHDCPICEGVGYWDRKDKVYFDIKGFRFNGNTIYKLILTASKLSQITINISRVGTPMLFQIADVCIVAVPCLKEDKDNEAVFLNIA